jgi:hypothetical protein
MNMNVSSLPSLRNFFAAFLLCVKVAVGRGRGKIGLDDPKKIVPCFGECSALGRG